MMTQPVRPVAPAASLRRRARLMRLLNVPMRFILGLPFPTPLSGALMLLSFRGRKTGRAYQQPVSYVRDGDVLLTPGGGRWQLNLRQGQPVRIRLCGRDVLGRPEFVRDAGEVERLLLTMQAANARVAAFVPAFGPDGRLDRPGLEAAVRHGFTLIRWRLDQVRP